MNGISFAALESTNVSSQLPEWINLVFGIEKTNCLCKFFFLETFLLCSLFHFTGYKLSGNAAIKSKNVYLSMVDNHQTLGRRGIVQLFKNPHPPKQYQTIWTSKTPPRIYSQTEIRQRMTRSTESLLDLSNNKYRNENEACDSNVVGGGADRNRSTSKSRIHHPPPLPPPHIPEGSIYNTPIERSPSLHSNVLKSQNQIILPKDYNPIEALNAVENMEIFFSKTFYLNPNNESSSQKGVDFNQVSTVPSMAAAAAATAACSNDEGINAFTNKIFSDRFEENLMKDTKRLHNLNHKNLFVQNSTRNYKQIISSHRHLELQVIACIIVELFLANKLRPLGIGSKKLADRIEACKNVLKADFDLLPKCVHYPVKLFFSLNNDEDVGDGNQTTVTVTNVGLPKPSPHQLLQPFLSNFLFPFPYEYLNTFTLLKTLYQYETANKLLDFHTYYAEYDDKAEAIEKQRTLYKRKIAECKVMACSAQIERLLAPHGYEQFNVVDLILPHIIALLKSENTSILAAWFLFDHAAVSLGQSKTQKYLLDPILKLYEAECDERAIFLNSNFDASMKSSTSSFSSFKSRKTIKLYHHSFLLRLIVRFGLSCFLSNFVPPLIEAIGGCKEPIFHQNHHRDNYNSTDNATTSKSASSKSRNSEVSNNAREPDEMFTFESGENDDLTKASANLHLTDSSDNDDSRPHQFESTSNDGMNFSLFFVICTFQT